MDLTKNLTPSEFKNVSIRIRSDYLWGSGWTSESSKKFESVIYPQLIEAGFRIKESTSSGSCDTLVKPNCEITDIYMHPMEFAGYAIQEDIDKICDILSNSKSVVYDILSVRMRPAYILTDAEYSDILSQHSQEILDTLRVCNKKNRLYDFEFEIMRNYKILRVGDTAGVLSSSSFEYQWLNAFKKVMQELKII